MSSQVNDKLTTTNRGPLVQNVETTAAGESSKARKKPRNRRRGGRDAKCAIATCIEESNRNANDKSVNRTTSSGNDVKVHSSPAKVEDGCREKNPKARGQRLNNAATELTVRIHGNEAPEMAVSGGSTSRDGTQHGTTTDKRSCSNIAKPETTGVVTDPPASGNADATLRTTMKSKKKTVKQNKLSRDLLAEEPNLNKLSNGKINLSQKTNAAEKQEKNTGTDVTSLKSASSKPTVDASSKKPPKPRSSDGKKKEKQFWPISQWQVEMMRLVAYNQQYQWNIGMDMQGESQHTYLGYNQYFPPQRHHRMPRWASGNRADSLHSQTREQQYGLLGVPINYDIYTQDELWALLQKAREYLHSKSSHKRSMQECLFFYRDKSIAYYNDIMNNHFGIMRTYLKDFHGDPKSPANGHLNGLFFSVNMDKRTGMPPAASIYGDQRMLICPDSILQTCHNLYFTDFYCVNDAHYVTLVMTRTGTISDQFCRTNLVRMSLNVDNDICRAEARSGRLVFLVTTGLWVEIMITENIDINWEMHHGAMFHFVHMKGNRSGGRVGLKKKLTCKICNL